MSKELDKRIAIEVMGEPEPPPPPEDDLCRGTGVITGGHFSWQGNWEALELWDSGDVPTWFPVPFSSDLDQAMRAVDKYFKDIKWEKPWLSIHYSPWPNVSPGEVWEATTFGGEDNDRSADGYGQTLPEAICNLLIALKGD